MTSWKMFTKDYHGHQLACLLSLPSKMVEITYKIQPPSDKLGKWTKTKQNKTKAKIKHMKRCPTALTKKEI